MTCCMSNPRFSGFELSSEKLQVVLIYLLSATPWAAFESVEASDLFPFFDHSDPVQFPLK